MGTLYSFRRCPYAMRARLALQVSGAELDLVEVSLKAKPARMLELSPKGTVPVVELDDGTVIDESLDIMLWTLRRNDPEGWLGADDASLAEMQALIAQNDGDFKHHLDRTKYAVRYEGAEKAAEAHLAYLTALGAIDDKFDAACEAAVEKMYEENCVEEEPGKFRCPLSGKLFKEVKYVRKHIDNKHPATLETAKRAALEGKFEEYFLAGAEQKAAMPPPPPPPARFPREALDDGRPPWGEGKGGKGRGKGKGKGKGGRRKQRQAAAEERRTRRARERSL